MTQHQKITLSAGKEAVRPLAQVTQDGQWRLSLAHDVPYPRLFWSTRGQGTIVLNGARQGLSGHTMVYVPAGKLAAITVAPGAFGSVLALRQDAQGVFPEYSLSVRIVDMNAQKLVSGLFENLQRELQSDAAGSDLAANAHAMLIAVWIERELARQQNKRMTASERLMQSFSDMLAGHYAAGEGVGWFANELGVTPTHLARTSNAMLGMSSSKFLADRIFYEARRLLRDTSLSASKISQQLGFSTPAYFTRAFQSHSGETPTSFRQSTPQTARAA